MPEVYTSLYIIHQERDKALVEDGDTIQCPHGRES